MAKQRFKQGDVVYRVRRNNRDPYAWKPVTAVGYFTRLCDCPTCNRDHGKLQVQVTSGGTMVGWDKDFELWPEASGDGPLFRAIWNGIGYEERSAAVKPGRIARDILRRFRHGPLRALRVTKRSTNTLLSGTYGGKEFIILGV